METAMKSTLRIVVASAIACAITSAANAAYPEKPVRIVVPYAPGGAVDVVARKIAQKLTEQTGNSFFVENKPGATGTIGTQQLVRSAPDGYNILALDNTYSILPFVFKKLPWDHEKALTPITIAMFAPVLVIVPANSRFKDLASLLAEARANPEKLTYGTGGQGSAPHFATEAFQQAANVKLAHIPYKGAGEAMLGLISSQIDLALVSTGSALSQLRAGKIRGLAVSGTKRLSAFPDIPTFAEAGLPEFSVSNWSGLAAPAGTPAEIVSKLHAEVRKALASPDMKEFLESLGADPGGIEPSEVKTLIREETAGWEKVSERAGIERQ
jgi:tripartite-type tricarboxylate transporter receptor subunit TctC